MLDVVATLACSMSLGVLGACPPYPPPEHGIVSSTTPTQVGQAVVITCNIGYQLSTEGRATPKCAEYPPEGTSGGFDPEQGNRTREQQAGYQLGATCQPRTCGRFPAPAYGRVVPDGLIVYGQHATIVCDPGFRAVGLPGSKERPACQADGSFEMGKMCQRIQLDCLSAVSTAEDNIKDGHQTYQNQTCHPDTQYCVTAVKGTTVWRGCGPPVFKVRGEVVPHYDWLREVIRKDAVNGRQSSEWLSSHFLCQEGSMEGRVSIAATAYGGGQWRFRCCCSMLCNSGFKCVQDPLGAPLKAESSAVTYHAQCPAESSGCYSITASGAATGWRLVDEASYRLQSLSDPLVTAAVVFETTSGRPPLLGEEMAGHLPGARVSTDSWVNADTSVQYIDTAAASTFAYQAVIKAWAIFARAPGVLRLLVWRKAPGANMYTLVGENVVTIASNYGQTAVFLANSSGGQILVEAGDHIGWAHMGPGVLEYDADPGGDKLVRFIYGSSRVGEEAEFTLPDARRYSMYACAMYACEGAHTHAYSYIHTTRYSIRAFYDPTANSSWPLNTAPVPGARNCYENLLRRFGLRCSAAGAALGAAVTKPLHSAV